MSALPSYPSLNETEDRKIAYGTLDDGQAPTIRHQNSTVEDEEDATCTVSDKSPVEPAPHLRLVAPISGSSPELEASQVDDTDIDLSSDIALVAKPTHHTPGSVSVPLVLQRDDSFAAHSNGLRKSGVQQSFDDLRVVGTETLLGMRRVAIQVIQRFERLPRRIQMACVAAPYAVATMLIVIVGVVRLFSGPATATIPTNGMADDQMHALQAAAQNHPAQPNSPHMEQAAEPASTTMPGPATGAAPVLRSNPPSELSQLQGESRIMPNRSALYLRPNPKSPSTLTLKSQARLTVYPTFPTEEGWILAQTPGGSVGFVSQKHLAGEPDDALNKAKADKKKKRRRRQRRRRRR